MVFRSSGRSNCRIFSAPTTPLRDVHVLNAQYTPPTPPKLICRVESHRRREHNSQLVGDSLDESEQIWQYSELELRHVGAVNAPVGIRDPVYNFLCCSDIEVGDK